VVKGESGSTDDILVPGVADGQDSVKRFLARYDAPAYARRARRVEEAFEQLISRCRRQRDEWLSMVRIQLAMLHDLAGDWEQVRPLLAGAEQLTILQHLHGTLEPRLRVPVSPTSSTRKLAATLRDLVRGLERFNQRWQGFLEELDLAEINELRDGYNRYYLLEKECAMRSARLARQGYAPLPPLTLEDLRALLPLLPVPQLKE
jgi:hypothetical protein